ncbi:MAG TPA: hypothetical protein VGC85_08105, partial [Chthoniobacterales bacterium]
LNTRYNSSERTYRLGGIAILFCTLVTLAVGCIARSFDHDEGQFIASGALLARERLLPYLDYPYFHFPNLSFIFAALFSGSSYLLLTARSFNIVCAELLLVLVFVVALRASAFLGEKRWLAASAVTLLLALNPFFKLTTGRAWNHDLPILCSFVSFLALMRGLQPGGRPRWIAASGALLGLALGTRLTFVPLLLPLCLLTFMFSPPEVGKARRLVLLLGSCALVMLPTILLFAATPGTFLFDNVTMNGSLNRRYRLARHPKEYLLMAKLFVPLRLLLRRPSSLLLAIAFYVFAWRLPSRANQVFQNANTAAYLVIVPFGIAGAMLPSPSHEQYYGMVIPFVVLGTAAGMAQAWKQGSSRLVMRFVTAIIAIGLIETVIELHRSGISTPRRQWAVWTKHEIGREVSRFAGNGRILTLAPIYPLEGGAGIYKEFCTGPFAWRVSTYADEKDQLRYKLPTPDRLESFLGEKPAGILTDTGESARLERPLVEYARNNGYTPTKLANALTLWLPPRSQDNVSE